MNATPTSHPRTRAGRPRWGLAALAALPLLELVVLIWLAQLIGFWWTLTIVLGSMVLGAVIARRETGRAYRALNEALASGKMPGKEMTDLILVTLGGGLLMVPGVVSDLPGLFLVLPFTRPLARKLLHTAVAGKVVAASVPPGGMPGSQGGGSAPDPGRRRDGGDIIEGEVIDEEPPLRRSIGHDRDDPLC